MHRLLISGAFSSLGRQVVVNNSWFNCAVCVLEYRTSLERRGQLNCLVTQRAPFQIEAGSKLYELEKYHGEQQQYQQW